MNTPEDYGITMGQALKPEYSVFWKADGNCRTYPAEVFYPEDGAGVARAKKICSSCPVETICLEFAIANGEKNGVWGNTSVRERRHIFKLRRIGGSAVTGSISDADLNEF
jgi:WhiB family redox-sensing transcriptional regulator